MSKSSFFRNAFAYGLAGSVILHSAITHADDTEIFFGGPAIEEGIRPNVLFILDNSGSMAWRTDSNNNPSGAELSRMQILKNSFSSIINAAGPINAGVMVLNSREAYDNTRMVYPVSYLNDPLPSSVQNIASTPQILASGDDATQINSSSNAVIGDNALLMGNITTTTTTTANPFKYLEDSDAFFLRPYGGADWACRMDKPSSRTSSPPCTNDDRDNINIRAGGDDYTGNPIRSTALLYFRDIRDTGGNRLPASAATDPTLTAYLELRPTNTQTPPTIQVTVENSKTAVALNDNSQVGTRNYLATANIVPSSWNSSQTARIDISALIKSALAAAPTANPLENLFIKLRATNNTNYTFCTRNCGTSGSVSLVPRLMISYSATASVAEQRTGGLRFQNVGIPQGATITSARIDFAPAADNSDPVTFEVKAERAGDAAVFTNSTNLSARSKTTALTSWTPTAWTTESPPVHIAGPDVTSQVQEVVGLSGWCGNNSMAFYLTPTSGTGSRTAHSIDGAPGLQPTLTVTYTGGTNGCLNPIVEANVTTAKNDAFQGSDGSMRLADNTLPVDRSRFAARYEGVPIKQGAQILDTQVILTPANTVTGTSVTSTVRFENADNAAPITGSNNDISNRSSTANSSCSFTTWVQGSPVTCSPSGLKTGLQSVVNRSGWTPGNSLLVMFVQSADTNMNVKAYDSNPGESIKLRIKVAHGGLSDTTYTVRQHINSLVQSMNASDGTPIVPTYYEAAQYLKGQRAGFTSPITSACQATHVVLLTDGQANGYTSGSQTGIASWAGSCTGDATDNNEKCGRTLAGWLGTSDQSTFTGDNFIKTHTIGFALNALAPNTAPQRFLNDIADRGEGTAYTADNASELTAAFSEILQEVLSTNTTFVSASAPVNTFNRQENKDELYFSLFRPSETDRWVGNLKRYRMDTSTPGLAVIVDADNVPAIDPNTGFFSSTARSFWSTADGSDVGKGGAAGRLPGASARKLFTFYEGGTLPANLADYPITDNADLTNDKLGVSTSTERTQVINYIRGLDPVTGDERKAVGDPLHAAPRLITYGCAAYSDPSTKFDCTQEIQSVIIGTNEGLVQLFDTSTGVEQFAFMPEVLLPNIKQLKNNAASSSLKPRLYGMDNSVAVWFNDVNRNGVIYGGRQPDPNGSPLGSGVNPGEFVYAYATMGRGGRDVYALDITDKNVPKLLWQIRGGVTAGFEHLGQTWSVPVKTKIKIGSTVTDVLIFGGGYDEDQDDADVRTADDIGNALYIVNARTGALIWSGGSGAGHTQTLSKMQYSIPSGVRVIDLQQSASGVLELDPEGLADQIFVGDMGGQVWRLYINNGSSGAGLISLAGSGDGVFASVGGASEATARRFYHDPDVTLVSMKGTPTLIINIGSGYRGHPLDDVIQDRFYSFRTSTLFKPTSSEGTLSESGLYDATSNLVQTGTAAEQTVANEKLLSPNGGWFIRLTNLGEKVLSRALAFNGRLFFNTYEPTASNESCKAAVGVNRAYAVNLLDATPVITTRYLTTTGGALPSDPQLYCKGDFCHVIGDPSLGALPAGDPPCQPGDDNCKKCRDDDPMCVIPPNSLGGFWLDNTNLE